MKNLNYILSDDICCGCGICAGICKLQCIEMRVSDQGFYRPFVNKDRCIECGICLRKCPMYYLNKGKYDKSSLFGKVLSVYSGYAKNKDIRKKSASGGIATALSLELLNKNFIICGTGYDEKNILRTKTIITDKCEDVLKLMSSKYMPSQYSDVIRYIKRNIESKILVIGLPCQIAGIRNLVGYEKSNIILIDILCGKVMSYRLIEKYIESLQINGIESINFRDKATGWYNYSLSIIGKNKQDSKYFRESIFGRFLNNKLFTQESCYNCRYGSAGLSDITLGDFWDKERFENERDGISIIVARTKIGKKIIEESDYITINKEKIEDLEKTQPHFLFSISHDNKRALIEKNKKLYKDIDRYSLERLSNLYNNDGIISKIKRNIKKTIGSFIK